MADTIIVWFRRDLRLHDNPALHQARDNGARIVPVYIYAPEEEAPWRPGAASRWWLHHSLPSLTCDLASLNWTLKIFRGDSRSALLLLAEQSGARAVYWNRLYDPAAVARDTRVKTARTPWDSKHAAFRATCCVNPGKL